nr:uncharacterized protein LOC121115365 [Lepeophtheirus salmonis]
MIQSSSGPRCCSIECRDCTVSMTAGRSISANSMSGVVLRGEKEKNRKSKALSKVQKIKKRLSQSFGKLALSSKDVSSLSTSTSTTNEKPPTPSKLNKLRYAGYSAEFLDRVEPNGNIPHERFSGKEHLHTYIIYRFCILLLPTPFSFLF